jgi:hypothetical protein
MPPVFLEEQRHGRLTHMSQGGHHCGINCSGADPDSVGILQVGEGHSAAKFDVAEAAEGET